ncbi:MAG: fasciclin domain-containing protein [Allosphingosinicella sp.]
MFKHIAAAALLASVPVAAGALAFDHHGKPAKAGKKDAGTIVAAAMKSPDHETLVAAVKAAGLVDTLAGPGPFTVFAPTDAAFARLPAGTVDTLLKPENKAALQGVLTYHVVAGRVAAADLIGMIEKNGGTAEVTTVQGGKLTARLMDGKVVLTDAQGGRATVTGADLMTGNGIIHVTDAVSLPG